MRLARYDRVFQEFPDCERSKPRLLLEFERDGERVVKFAALTGALLATAQNRQRLKRELLYLCSKLAREADRDIAFIRHGSEFRKHCEYQSNFWDLLPHDEMEKFDAAIDAFLAVH